MKSVLGSVLLSFFLAGSLFAQVDFSPQNSQSPPPPLKNAGITTIAPLTIRHVEAQLPSSQPAIPQPNPAGGWLSIDLKKDTPVISKKPRIEVKFLRPIKPESLVVMLDSVDVSLMLEKTAQGFVYDPILVLPAGSHTLSVQARDNNNQTLQTDLQFTTRHTEKFEELFTSNEASLNYEGALIKADTATSIPSSKIEGNLNHSSKIRAKEWEVSFRTNLRYLDQSTPVTDPLKKGVDAVNWLLSGKYQKEGTFLRSEFGDVTINESLYTSQFLARRGGMLALGHKNFDVRVFNVLSKQVFGLQDGMGFQSISDESITGTSAGLKLFNNQAEVRGIYLTGGEKGNSFGVSSLGGAKKGDVVGFLGSTDFFRGILKSEIEAGFSHFDANTSDTIDSRDDKAYRLKLFGNKGVFSYEAQYEYVGNYYEVVGNPSIQKNKEGFALKGGGNFSNAHNVNLLYSQYNDNVRGDSLLPKVYTYQGTLDYSFNRFPQLPMGMNLQRTVQESTQEPAGATPMKVYADTVSGRIGYMMGPLNLGFQTSYSARDDQTPANQDNTTTTYTFTPAYNRPGFSINPSFSLNQTKTSVPDVRIDNYMVNLQVMAKALNDQLSLEMACTYNVISSTNNSQDSRNLSANFRVAYALGKYLKGFFSPSIGLKGLYSHILDHVNPSAKRDEFSLLLVFTATMPFSY